MRIFHSITATVVALLILNATPAEAMDALNITKNMDCLPSSASAQVLTEIYRRAGIPLNIVPMPAARGAVEVAEGRADGEVVRISKYGETRPYLIRVEPAYSQLEISVFHKQTFKKVITPTTDLSPFYLGVVRSIKAAEDIVAKAPTVERLNNSAQLVQILNADRIELAIDIADEFKRVQKRLNITGIVEVPLVKHELFHYLHKKHAALAEPLGRVIVQMKRTGELKRLMDEATLAIGASCLNE